MRKDGARTGVREGARNPDRREGLLPQLHTLRGAHGSTPLHTHRSAQDARKTHTQAGHQRDPQETGRARRPATHCASSDRRYQQSCRCTALQFDTNEGSQATCKRLRVGNTEGNQATRRGDQHAPLRHHFEPTPGGRENYSHHYFIPHHTHNANCERG